MKLVLASTSPFRKMLLERLKLPFETVAPDVDESPLCGESPKDLVERLAEAKARAVADQYPDSLIIGSDQVAECGGEVLGKPGDHATAVAQLRKLSGQRVIFHTGLCLLDTNSGQVQIEVVDFPVLFRAMDVGFIERYLNSEPAYNCAGAFRSEGLGVALCERFEGDDPTALIGLPLIRLVRMLEVAGMPVV